MRTWILANTWCRVDAISMCQMDWPCSVHDALTTQIVLDELDGKT